MALTLLSFVVTLIYGAFTQISGGAVTMTREMETRQSLRVLLKLIVDDLQAAQYLKNFASSERASGVVAEYRYTEDRQFTRIGFHAAVPTRFFRQTPPGKDPGIHEIGYEVALDSERGTRVLVRREDFYLDNDLQEGGMAVPLAEHIDTFKVEFLPVTDNPYVTTEEWQEEWNSAQAEASARLPAAMRLTIGQRSEDKVYSESMEFNLLQGMGES